MTDEELERLKKEVAEKIQQLSADPRRPLSKQEKKDKILLRAKSRALDSIVEARKKGTIRQEVRACMDYALLDEYGHRNWLIYNLARSRMSFWGF